MIADIDINRAAQELLDRYGDNAATMAQDRIADLTAGQDQAELNIALRVLSALESLIKDKPPAA